MATTIPCEFSFIFINRTICAKGTRKESEQSILVPYCKSPIAGKSNFTECPVTVTYSACLVNVITCDVKDRHSDRIYCLKEDPKTNQSWFELPIIFDLPM